MNHKCAGLFFCIMIILVILTGCSKESEIQLKLGQTLVEVMDNEYVYLEESTRVDNHSFKGKSLDAYIANYYHNSFDAFIKSNWTVYFEGDEIIEDYDYEELKDLIVVDVDRYNIKDSSTYIKTPGTVKLIFATDNPVEYEFINDSTIKITNWKNETSISVAYEKGDFKKLKKPKENYILFDFTTLDKLIYKEIIAVKLEDYRNGKIITPLNEWITAKGYSNYEDLIENISFRWAINKDKVSSKDFEKYEDAYVLSFGKITNDTYIRVPKEILFITDDVNYKYIDEETLLIHEGTVTIIYKD